MSSLKYFNPNTNQWEYLPLVVRTNGVESVNGMKGDVILDADDVGADPVGSASTAESNANDYTDTSIAAIDYPVDSVNGRTGTVTGLAENNAVVHLTGAETVAGIKTFSSSPIVPTPTTNTQAANKLYVDNAIGGIPGDAVTSVFGRTGAIVSALGDYLASQITNTPSGSISASTVQDAINELGTEKEPNITAGTTAQYWRGDKSWQALDKTAVGLPNVDNTTDLNKPISTATQTALNTKEPTLTAGTTLQYYRGDKTWQTLNTSIVPEGSNLYFTDSRAQAAIASGGLYVLKAGDTMSGALLNTSYVMASGSYTAATTTAGVYIGIPAGLNPRFTMANGTAGQTVAVDNNVGGIRFIQSSLGTVMASISTGGLVPGANLTQVIGSTSLYWSQGYMQRLNFNASSFIDGATAGLASLTGLLEVGSTNVRSTATTGITIYNTADQTTNVERLRIWANSNVFSITSEATGTGTPRQLNVTSSGAASMIVGSSTATASTYFNNSSLQKILHATGTTSVTGILAINNTMGLGATSGIQYAYAIQPAITQSSTAGYTALHVNATETSVGSGAKLLADFQVGSSSKARIDNAGQITVAGMFTAVRTATANTSVLTTDSVIRGDATTAGFNITLPTAVGITGRMYTIKKIDATANIVSVATTSSQNIDGSSTARQLSTQWASITVVSDGTGWMIV